MYTRLAGSILVGLTACVLNSAAAELPQHIPIESFAPDGTDFAEFSNEAQFGHAVAIRNGLAFMGMPLAQDSTGRVAVFAQTATGWRRIETLLAPNAGSDKHFGRTVAFRDGVLAVGSDKAVYVFRRSSGKFNFVQKLVAPAADGALEFPMALRYEAGTLFASAYRGSALPSVVYIYGLDASSRFVKRGRLAGPANELFGADLSTAGTTLVVGSPGGRSRLREFGLFHHSQGSAYVYQRDSSGSWRQAQRLLPTGAARGFGSAVAIDRGMIIVGAPQEDIEGGSRGTPTLDNHIAGGAAYVFTPAAGRYEQTSRLRPRPDERVQYMDFGHSIAMFDNNIVIGGVQPYAQTKTVPGGFVFTYRRDGANVVSRGIAAGHSVAYALGLFQNQLLVGTPGADRCDDIYTCSGTARIYDVSQVATAALPLTYRMKHVLSWRLVDPFDSAPVVTGMNDKGEVIGYFTQFGSPSRAFVWRDGAFETLSMPGRSLAPVAINDRSQIAANCQGRVCVRLNDQFALVDVPDDIAFAGVSDLSNEGHVLGLAFTRTEEARRYIWRQGTYTFLDPLPGFPETSPIRINDRGTIATGSASEIEGNQGPWRPVIWQNGTIMPLGQPPVAPNALARDVNNSGMVLLHSAQTWHKGAYTRLDPPDGYHQDLATFALNNQGVVAGYASASSGNVVSGIVATRWLGRHGTNLNWLISGADPLRPFVQSDQAWFVNDRNEILVQGSDGRDPAVSYYVLSPVVLQVQ